MTQIRTTLVRVCCCLLPLCISQRLHAQETAPFVQLQQSSAEVLRAFEPAEDEEYELGPGDEITISVNPASDLSGKTIVGPDGRVSLAFAGDIKVDGLTRSQAAAAIRAALTPLYQDIAVSVRVDRYVSNHILLLGAVERPGIIAFDGAPTLLDVIARGGIGGSSQAAAGQTSSQVVLRDAGGVPQVCLIYRGKQTLVTVRLRDLVKSGDPGINVRLRRNDVVFVPSNDAYVSVLGSVLHPGLLPLERRASLTELITEAGGMTDKSGRYPKIFIIHPSLGKVPGSIEVFSFKDILEAKPVHAALFPGDIIYVPESGFNRAADVLQKISPLINLITIGAVLR